MVHIEEHILELYSLGSGKIEPRRREIEAHLLVCVACRTLVEEMTRFYGEVQAEAELRREQELSHTVALVPSGRSNLAAPGTESLIHARPPQGIRRQLHFQITTHPFVAAFGAFALGSAAAGLFFFLNTSAEDTNPAYVFQSVDQNLVQVRTRDHRKLWDFPSFELKSEAEAEERRRVQTTLVTDLDGDGKKEVVTVQNMGDERLHLFLRVFDGQQRLQFSREFLQDFRYRDRSYTPRFCPNQVLTLPAAGEKGEEIFVVAVNFGRSPAYIARFDCRGNDIGQYWNFGNIIAVYPITLEPGQPTRLVVIGMNDTGDTSEVARRTSFPFAAVLDPSKIKGQKRSVTAPGYAMPPSDAEDFYIRFPLSSSDSVLAQTTRIMNLIPKDEGTLAFNLESAELYEGLKAVFEYTFNRQLQVLEVKTADITKTLVGRLLAEHKNAAKPDQAYLTYLKNRVRYWDGERWSPEPARISHPPGLAAGR